MSSEYLYPCPACDHSFTVEVSQAGRSTRCPFCSETLELPKLSEIRRLQPTDEPTEQVVVQKKKMGLAQTWMFIAGLPLILIGGFIGGDHMLRAMSLDRYLASVDLEKGVNEVNQQVQAQSPEQLWSLWHEEILENPPTVWQQSEFLALAQLAEAKRLIAIVAFVFVGIGVILIVTALAWPKKSVEQRSKLSDMAR